MKHIKFLISVLLLVSSIVGCQEELVDESVISLDKTIIDTNKKGLTYEGGKVNFEVTSNVYWIINKKESDVWLEVSPKAGSGSQQVQVSVQQNKGEARSAVLVLEAYDGTKTEITVNQASASEMIYYATTGFGDAPVSGKIPVDEFEVYGEGVGVKNAKLSGSGVFVGLPGTASDVAGGSGGNALVFEKLETEEKTEVIYGPIDTKGDYNFVCSSMFFITEGTSGKKPSFSVSNIKDGEYVNLEPEYENGDSWHTLTSRFYITEPSEIWLKITADEGVWVDDLNFREGNDGNGQEVAFMVGGDDGRPVGYTYFQDDFSWVTDVYGGSDYIAGWPDNTAEQYWNGVTADKFGEEAYNALAATGWTTSDNKLKERVYLRVGYVKMGRGSNAKGCGGGLVTPAISIKKNCAATLRVSFDCCNMYSTSGKWDGTTSMMVRIIGPGTINDAVTVEKQFQMSTSDETASIWNSGKPDKNPWERKEFIVNGATSDTRIVFESVEETVANRWFFDNILIRKDKEGAEVDPEKIPLAVPSVSYVESKSDVAKIYFEWNEIPGATEYEYEYLCHFCGQKVEENSGVTSNTFLLFEEMKEGTICEIKVRALPKEDDASFMESDWCGPVSGQTVVHSGVTDSHPVGAVIYEEDFEWVTKETFGQDSFVDSYPSNPAGISFSDAIGYSTAAKDALNASGLREVEKCYLYEGCIKLASSKVAGTVATPAMSEIDKGAKINGLFTIGCTAFLGTNDYRDDDLMCITIKGGGSFADGTDKVEFRIGAWNEWRRHSFAAYGVTSATEFEISTLTAAKGRAMVNYLSLVKLPDSYSSADELPALSVPENLTVSGNSSYGFDLQWTAVPDATDYTYRVVRPDGKIVAEGKAWEPAVHIGGLTGKDVNGHDYFNVSVSANNMNYDSGKNEIPAIFRSSALTSSVVAELSDEASEIIFQDDFSWTLQFGASSLLANSTDWINTYCTNDNMVRLDKLEEEGAVSLNGWSYDKDTYYSVYTRPGYIHLNSSKKQGCLISPAMSALKGTSNVIVSFDACYFYQYFSGTPDDNRKLTVALEGSGAIEGAADSILVLDLGRGNSWENFTLKVLGADSGTRIKIMPANAAKNRVQLDNFLVRRQ